MQPRASDNDPIRVLLGPMPELLRGMIEDLLSGEADMVVLGQAEDAARALVTARDASADMLIMQSDGEKRSLLDAIVGSAPFSIFAISDTGERATAIRFVHEAVSFDTSSRTAFAAAIRRIARSSAPHHVSGEPQWPA